MYIQCQVQYDFSWNSTCIRFSRSKFNDVMEYNVPFLSYEYFYEYDILHWPFQNK